MILFRHIRPRFQHFSADKITRAYSQKSHESGVDTTTFPNMSDKLVSGNKETGTQTQSSSSNRSNEHTTFPAMLRYSPFIKLGDPEGKVVNGKIFHIVEDDLYIDFGWKFHCVCPRPKKRSEDYIRGAEVRLKIQKLELASKFLGYEKDLTLLEADCILLGLNERKIFAK